MYSILIPTYRNLEYLQLCVDSIFKNSNYRTHQLCVFSDNSDKETIYYLDNIRSNCPDNFKLDYIYSEEHVGVSSALNTCADQAIYNNVLLASDDCYFTKNWDYHLHQWETELNNKFSNYVNIIGYRFCEPNFGSFPPVCDAGKSISEFDTNKLNDYIMKYSIHNIDLWFFNSLYPKDIFIKCRWSPEFYPKDCSDIDFGMTLLKYLKDNDLKFLIFSVKDCYIYHFQRISTIKNIGDSSIPKNIDNNNDILFEKKWSMKVPEAYNLLDLETERSISLIKNPLGLEREKNEDIKDFVRNGYIEILKRRPDNDGFINYVGAIDNGIISKDKFLEILRTSDEYKNVHRNE